jgi:sugar/nucleoside kinase (ribokinase family)
MNTYLGAGADLAAHDVPADPFRTGGILFLEGYLFDKEAGKTAFRRAAQLMHEAGGRAGITLSDPFCVDRHRADFRQLIAGEMDFVIGNEAEWTELYQTPLPQALDRAAADCGLVICTRSGDSVILIEGEERIEVPVERVVPVDATGAGDQFAAGFLYGHARGRDLENCGRMGVAAAAEVIGHVGPRPRTDLAERFRALGLL